VTIREASVAGVVLAGGSSRRLGRDKALLMLDGETLLTRALRVLRSVTTTQIVVGPDERRRQAPGVLIVPDLRPGDGPLAAIWTALLHIETRHALVVACDLPFLNPDLLAHLMVLRQGFDMVLPVAGGRPQQLHAVYARTCLNVIDRRLKAGDRRVENLFAELRVRRVDEDELRAYDPSLRSFDNVNTEDDWRAAQARVLNDRAPAGQDAAAAPSSVDVRQ
jgi:molybdopterin-guanine dinucleotide biosynthesis protein A